MPGLAKTPLTREIAAWAASTFRDGTSEKARLWAKHCLLDWLALSIAGSREPLSRILADEALSDGVGTSSFVGHPERGTASWAVMVNGTAGHALDFDDVNQQMIGHPTAVAMPALITLAEQMACSGRDVLDAFVIGYEVAARIGEMVGPEHYQQGYHTTATVGSLAACAGVSVLAGLPEAQITNAIGIAASRSAGLKCMFGTMTKPLQVGSAAQSGYLAFRLAQRGFTANPTAIEAPQGFLSTLAPDAPASDGGFGDPGDDFAITRNLFKPHAACFFTHATIDSVRRLIEQNGVDPRQIEKLRVLAPKQNLGSCNIADPTTDLECKFSLRHAAALAMAGMETAKLSNYCVTLARAPEITNLRNKVVVEGQSVRQADSLKSTIIAQLSDGHEITITADSGQPATNLNPQWVALSVKATSLIDPVLGLGRAAAIIGLAEQIETMPDTKALIAACSSARELSQR